MVVSKHSVVLCFVGISCLTVFIFVLQLKELKSHHQNVEKELSIHKDEPDAFRTLIQNAHITDSQSPGNTTGKHVVFYNRIPKTGSTTFTNQVYDLAKINKIYVTHINISRNSFKLSLFDQLQLVENVTTWNRKPAFYHGHFPYIPFMQFGTTDVLYINIMREPLERLMSYYYFLRYGDDFRKGLKRAKHGDTTTFNECVAKQDPGCAPRDLWLQIPFFCGHAAECWKHGSQWALEQAKTNLMTKYLVVGLTEQMEEFVVVLEAAAPHMFNGLAERFRNGKKSHIRKTLHKDPPSEATLQKLKNSNSYRMERELYDFAQEQFEFVKRHSTYTDENGLLQPMKGKRYKYEKMFGPSGRIRE